jgi:glutamine amidotransferase
MCRILGIVADEPAEFCFCLREARRSLGALSREHPDGWGVAVFDEAKGWATQKRPLSAFSDPRFGEVAGQSRGQVLVAHVRRRTVGPVSPENTHPFERGPWVFAHNGTIDEIDVLRAAASPSRLADVRGTTDSEVFFAYLLTHLDLARAEGGRGSPGDEAAALALALRKVASRATFGAANFLLSDGETLYAFRRGRTLHLLERSPDEEPRGVAPSPETGAALEGRWTARRHAVLVASEAITDEAWAPVEEGTLLKVTRRPRPEVTVLAGL